jgi:hypothetical protein
MDWDLTNCILFVLVTAYDVSSSLPSVDSESLPDQSTAVFLRLVPVLQLSGIHSVSLVGPGVRRSQPRKLGRVGKDFTCINFPHVASIARHLTHTSITNSPRLLLRTSAGFTKKTIMLLS